MTDGLRITDQALIRFLRATALIGGALAVIGSAMFIALGYAGIWWSGFFAFVALLAVFLAVFAWLVILKQPRNAVVWIMAACAISGGLYVAGWAGAAAVVSDAPNLLWGDFVVPADLPQAAALMLVVAEPASLVAILGWMSLGLLLFPDGRLPSRRWRWVGVLAVVSILTMVLGFGWSYRPGSAVPAAQDTPLIDTAFLAATLAIILALVALIGRFRRSGGATRQQFKWIVWGAAIFVPTLIAVSFTPEENLDLMLAPAMVATAIFLVSSGVAVGKYRLYDIDVVISKTVAYVSLAIAIAAIYGAAVFGVILLFGNSDSEGSDPGLVLPAAALVAILFEPLRVRMERLANRVVYGRRAAPHEVLSGVTSRLAHASAGGGLVGLARLLRDGIGAESAAVWLRVGNRLRVEAVSPADAQPTVPVVDSEIDLPASDLELSVPVHHGGELLGALGVTKPRSHPVSPADEDLLADVAAGAGLLLRNLRLDAELAGRAVQLQTSRRRLIAAHDAARHRLERDLHDGAQQQVVALKVMLGLAQAIAEKEGAHDLAVRVADLADGTQQAVDAMRIVARGIYPPLLEAEGLGPALTAAQRTSPVPVQIEARDLPRYAKETEETTYFCVLAAIKRAEMAGAASARVDVHGDGTSLTVTVTHDAADRGDLSALTDRVDALGGTVTTNTPTDATTLTLTLPAETKVMDPA